MRSFGCLLTFILLTAPSYAQLQRRDGGEPPKSAGGQPYAIRFSDQLGFNPAITIRGKARAATVNFYTELSSIPGAGTELHLFIRHSPNLDPMRSFLTVTLNYG